MSDHVGVERAGEQDRVRETDAARPADGQAVGRDSAADAPLRAALLALAMGIIWAALSRSRRHRSSDLW